MSSSGFSHHVATTFALIALAACGDEGSAGAGGSGGVGAGARHGAGAGATSTSENHTSTAGSHAGASGAPLVGASGRAGGGGVAGSANASSGSIAIDGASGASGVGGSSGTAAGGGAGGRAGASGSAAVGGAGALISGPSRCAASELLLCESFEANSLDSSLWATKLARPTLDDTRAARGAQSLHVHTAATGAAGIETKKIFPRPEGRYYGRMFVYFAALPTSPQWAHWTIVGANPTSGSGEIRVGGQHDGKIERFGVGTDQGPTGDWTNLDEDPPGATKPVQLEQWLCVEWLHDWANDVTRFYLDGVEHLSLATTKDVDHGGNSGVPYELPELGSVWVGFWNYDQGKPVSPSEFDLWIDEVAFDDERIGCER